MRPWDWFWSTASTSVRIMSQEAQVLPNLGPLKAVVKPRMETGMNSLVVTNGIHSTVKIPPTTSTYKDSLCIVLQLLYG